MVVLAVGFYQPLGGWLETKVGWETDLANLVAFVAIAVAVFAVTFVAHLIVRRQRKARVLSALAENLGGAVAGAVRMLFVMAWVTVLLCLVRSQWWHEQIAHKSRAGAWLVDHLPTVAAVVDKQFPEKLWFLDEIKRPNEPEVEPDAPKK
jgi:hypothetical protein